MKSIVLLRFKLKTKQKEKTKQYIKVLIREITSCTHLKKKLLL